MQGNPSFTWLELMSKLEEGFYLSLIFQSGMPFKYLGIPLASEKLQIMDYSSLMDSLIKKIKSWPKNTLSYLGKANFITSVLQGVECFCMSILLSPCGIIDHIYRICKMFMWTSKYLPVTWAEMCKPKEKRGLDFKNLKAWNLILLAKVLWRIQVKQDTLWFR